MPLATALPETTACLTWHPPKWGERYLEEILGALARLLALLSDRRAIPQLQIGKLIIACHSGGGNGMRNLVGSLGKYQAQADGLLGI